MPHPVLLCQYISISHAACTLVRRYYPNPARSRAPGGCRSKLVCTLPSNYLQAGARGKIILPPANECDGMDVQGSDELMIAGAGERLFDLSFMAEGSGAGRPNWRDCQGRFTLPILSPAGDCIRSEPRGSGAVHALLRQMQPTV